MTKSHNTAPRTLKEILQTPATKAAAIAGIAATALTGCYGTQAGGQAPEVTVSTELPTAPYTPWETPEAPEPTPDIIYEDIDTYWAMSPEELSQLPIEERMLVWDSLRQGDEETGRPTFEEYTQDFYDYNERSGVYGVFTEGPMGNVTVDSDPQDISLSVEEKIMYAFAFEPEERSKVFALILEEGTESDAYHYWMGLSNKLTAGITGGGTLTASGIFPRPAKIESATPIEVNKDGYPSMEITIKRTHADQKDEHLVETVIYVENTYETQSGETVTLGNWVRY